MSFQEQITKGMRVAFSAFGAQVVIGSETVDCVQSDNENTEDLIQGGFMPDYAFTLHVLKADLTALPSIGDTVLFPATGGSTYRILAIGTSEGDPEARLACGSKEK